MFNFILLRYYTGTYCNILQYKGNPRMPADFFEADIWCRNFRRIFWYHSLVPPIFFITSYSGFKPFWPITRKRLIFEIWFRSWAPIFFNYLSDGLFTFLGVEFFWKLSLLLQFSHPVLLNLTRPEELFVLEKTLLILISIFAPLIMADETDAERQPKKYQY